MYNTYLRHVPKLTTFKEALKHYESIKPLRGKSIRPFITGGTGRKHKEISICYNGKNTVSIKIYGDTVLSFFQDRPRLDEYVYVTPKHVSHMKLAMAVVDRVLRETQTAKCTPPDNLVFRDHGYHDALIFDRATRDWITITDGIRLKLRKWKAGAEWHLIERPKMYGYYAKRKVLNEKKELVATFTKYTRAMAKMADAEDYVYDSTGFSTAERYAEAMAKIGQSVTAQDLWECMLDEESWPQASAYILRRCVERRDEYGYLSNRRGSYQIRPKDVSAYITRVVKAVHAKEIFELREVRTLCYNNNDIFVNCRAGS